MRQCIVLIFHIWAGQASCLFIYAHVQDGCCGLACHTLSTQGTLYNFMLPEVREAQALYTLSAQGTLLPTQPGPGEGLTCQTMWLHAGVKYQMWSFWVR